MFRRLLGILYLIRALTPFVVIAAIAIGGVYIINELQTTLAPPIQELGNAVNELETEARAIQGELKQVSQDLTKVADTLEDFTEIPDLIPNIPSSINMPRLDIPNVNVPLPQPEVKFTEIDLGVTKIDYPSDIDFSNSTFNMDIPAIPPFEVPVPGLGELDDRLGQALKPVTSIFAEFNKVFAGANRLKSELEKAAESANKIVSQGEVLLTSIQEILAKQRGRLMFALVLLVLLSANYFLLPAINDFRKGLLLLRGLPAHYTESRAL